MAVDCSCLKAMFKREDAVEAQLSFAIVQSINQTNELPYDISTMLADASSSSKSNFAIETQAQQSIHVGRKKPVPHLWKGMANTLKIGSSRQNTHRREALSMSYM